MIASKALPNWASHVKTRPENLKKLRDSGINPKDPSYCTIISYGRSIYDSQAKKSAGLEDIDDPLIQQMIVLNDHDYWQNANNLDEAAHYDRFHRNLAP
jgi:hypothetical protein